MNHSIVLSLAIALSYGPTAALAQAAPPVPGSQLEEAAPPPGPPGGRFTAQQAAAMQQLHAQFRQAHLLTRARMLAALTPAHRAAVANLVGQLVISANPDPRAAAQSLDALLAPVEKQSIVGIAAAERSNMHALMEQQRANFESTLSAAARAAMQQREAQRQAYMQSHSRREPADDPGAIVLRTLSSVGAGPGMHGPPGMHGGPF